MKLKIFCSTISFLFLLAGCNDSFKVNQTDQNTNCSCTDGDAFGGGAGSAINPYKICKRDHLDELQLKIISNYADFFDKNYKITCSFDMGVQAFTPIGNQATTAVNASTDNNIITSSIQDPNAFPFQGVLDGNGKTITGLKLTGNNIQYYGLFNYLGSSSTVQNLTLASVDIDLTGTTYFVGALSGKLEGTIQDITISGDFDADVCLGCSLGVGASENATIINLRTNGSLTATGYDAGVVKASTAQAGAIGIDYSSTITNSSSSVTVEGYYYPGGFAGLILADSVVNNCFATGNVSGKDHSGGFVGSIAGQSGLGSGATVTNSYATGNVESNNGAGSSGAGGFARVFKYASCDNCYATGQVTSDDDGAGLMENSEYSNISNSYATGNVFGKDASGFVDNFKGGTCTNCYATGNATGTEGAFGFSHFPWAGAVFNKIYATGTVTSLDSTLGTRDVSGLFGYLSGANGNVTITNCYSTSNLIAQPGNSEVGGIIAELNSYQNTMTITNCYFAGSITGGNNVGTIIGRNNFSGGSLITTDVFYDITVEPVVPVTGDATPYATGQTTGDLQDQSFYPIGWNFASVWQISAPNTYPTFR